MAKGKTKRLMERRRFLKRLHGEKEEAADSKTEAEPDPNADELFKDEVDLFHENRQQVQRDRSSLLEPALSSSSSEEDEEEVMGLGLDESEEEEDGDLGGVEGDENDVEDSGSGDEDEEGEERSDTDEVPFGAYEQKLLSRFEKYLHSSDEEMHGEEEGQGEGQLTGKSWGRSKKVFYSTDFIDDEIGGPSDEELAEEEEIEAIALQRQMAEEIAVDAYTAPEKMVMKEAKFRKGEKSVGQDEMTIATDLSKLSKEEKLQILAKESPELFELLDEYKSKLELVTRWQPLIDSIGKTGDGDMFTQQGKELLQLLFHSYLIYCLNLAFYLKLKAQRQPVKTHPVIGRIAEMRTALSQLQEAEAHLRPQIEQALRLLQEKEGAVETEVGGVERKGEVGSVSGGDEVLVSSLRQKLERERTESKKGAKRKAEQIGEARTAKVKRTKKKKDTDTSLPTKEDDNGISSILEDFDPEEFYQAAKAEKEKRKRHREDRLSEVHDAEDKELLGPDGKRAITYQIARNKGLTPKRKKEQRNPRVKHRKKFDRAKVRRKGQVRSVVADEGSYYGGERSGIKSTVSRSIKLK